MSVSWKISGKSFVAEVASTVEIESRPGDLWVAIVRCPDGSVKRQRVAFARQKNHFWASVSGQALSGERVPSAAARESPDSELVAQFPGKVRKILVQVGMTVSKGDPLLLVEAMKMEFSVRSPMKGKVQKILVEEGQALTPGDRYLEIDTDG